MFYTQRSVGRRQKGGIGGQERAHRIIRSSCFANCYWKRVVHGLLAWLPPQNAIEVPQRMGTVHMVEPCDNNGWANTRLPREPGDDEYVQCTCSSLILDGYRRKDAYFSYRACPGFSVSTVVYLLPSLTHHWYHRRNAVFAPFIICIGVSINITALILHFLL